MVAFYYCNAFTQYLSKIQYRYRTFRNNSNQYCTCKSIAVHLDILAQRIEPILCPNIKYGTSGYFFVVFVRSICMSASRHALPYSFENIHILAYSEQIYHVLDDRYLLHKYLVHLKTGRIHHSDLHILSFHDKSAVLLFISPSGFHSIVWISVLPSFDGK